MFNIVVSICVAVMGVAVYFIYTGLIPAHFVDRLKGIKTNVLGGIVFFAPDAISLLSMVQSFGLIDFVPSEKQVLATKLIGVSIVVLRFITTREQKDE